MNRLTGLNPLQKELAKTMSEDALVNYVATMGHATGWLIAHFRSVKISRRDGSMYYATPAAIDGEGFPDLWMVNARQKRILAVETKKQYGVVSDSQKHWLEVLEATGKVEHGIWRPSDWLNGEIERALR